MLRSLDSIVRSNIWVYNKVRKSAVFFCRYLLLEEGFSFLRYIEPALGTSAIDIGSNDGTSIEMIRQMHPRILIDSFDPVTSPVNLYSGVTYRNLALGEKTGHLHIFVPTVRNWTLTQYSSDNLEKIAAQLMEDFDVAREEIAFDERQVDCIPLDSLGLNPFFIKIDVEGQEESVVKGAIRTIVDKKPILLVEIQSFEGYRSLQDIMSRLGYFNLRWPQARRGLDIAKVGHYSRKRNNYLWIPESGSSNWVIRRVR